MRWIAVVMAALVMACGVDAGGGGSGSDVGADARDPATCGICRAELVCRPAGETEAHRWERCDGTVEGNACVVGDEQWLCVRPPEQASRIAGGPLFAVDPPCSCYSGAALVDGEPVDLMGCFTGRECE